jgi:hypothetical protein
MFGEATWTGHYIQMSFIWFKFWRLLHNHTVEYQSDLALHDEGQMCNFSIFLGDLEP